MISSLVDDFGLIYFIVVMKLGYKYLIEKIGNSKLWMNDYIK